MFERLKKVLKLDYESQRKRKCAAYLSSLPRPSQQIVLGSPLYRPDRYFCEVLIQRTDLLAWLEDHYSRCSGSIYSDVLMSWLRGIQAESLEPTHLDLGLFEAIEGYEEKIISHQPVIVICEKCAQRHSSIVEETRDLDVSGSWRSGTSIWKCPSGHMIYKHKWEMHYKFAT